MDEKENLDGKKSKSFRNFMVFQMEENQYKRFERFCAENGMNFAPAVTLLLNTWDTVHAYSGLHERIDTLENSLKEEKKEPTGKKTWGEKK